MKKQKAGASSKETAFYVGLIVVSILLVTLAMTVLGNTKLIAHDPDCNQYLFICRQSHKTMQDE